MKYEIWCKYDEYSCFYIKAPNKMYNIHQKLLTENELVTIMIFSLRCSMTEFIHFLNLGSQRMWSQLAAQLADWSMPALWAHAASTGS